MSFNDLKDLLDQKLEQSNLNLEGKQVIALAFLTIILVAGGFIYYMRSKPTPIIQDVYSTKNEKPALKTKKSKPKMDLIVHVCGAVVNPGVFRLKEGDRVFDAISSSGGANGEANLDSLNLAAKLTDGQKVYVPKKGEQVSASLSGSPSGSSQQAESAPINLNTATAEELDSLPGVGEVLAQRIIEYRESKGNFSAIEDLRNVEGIGPKKFENIKNKVVLN